MHILDSLARYKNLCRNEISFRIFKGLLHCLQYSNISTEKPYAILIPNTWSMLSVLFLNVFMIIFPPGILKFYNIMPWKRPFSYFVLWGLF